ncbi:glycosyltransferase [Spelaeicoccus albus]|uniref:D-inositol 3-phosphate glycosyltransferase n=1 Tax=Spelaeicoccus albus TaxID=1280376 RepID=A0A7Z0A9G3_9MICO|nr:glycosyltransferase [Spelaeicoccus albus]NYI66015.1 D-inositol-3-phosphate glycosyltransferase [Spelaeicoccus albus]
MTVERAIDSVVMLSLHTSPLVQPGSGDAGGLNVYVRELARQLAGRGVTVDIYTLDVDDSRGDVIDVAPGLRVHQLAAAGPGRITRDDFDAGDLAARLAAEPAVQRACVVHSHYWLSGVVALELRRMIGMPIVHTMHTMAKVKYRDFNHAGEHVERVGAEDALARRACLIANTEREARDLVNLYGADPERVEVVHPGVNHDVFTPGDAAAARRRLGLTGRDLIVLVVGRIQHLKGADVVIDALAVLASRSPGLARRVAAVMIGGDSGGRGQGIAGLTRQAAACGVSDAVMFAEPVRPSILVDWYRAADVVAVPSRSESFGLVAAEAEASGTPVIAADIGGLSELVDDGVSGVLVGGHDPSDWAEALSRVLGNAELRARMGRAAPVTVAKFDWSRTADETMHVYGTARECNERGAFEEIGGRSG